MLQTCLGARMTVRVSGMMECSRVHFVRLAMTAVVFCTGFTATVRCQPSGLRISTLSLTTQSGWSWHQVKPCIFRRKYHCSLKPQSLLTCHLRPSVDWASCTSRTVSSHCVKCLQHGLYSRKVSLTHTCCTWCNSCFNLSLVTFCLC